MVLVGNKVDLIDKRVVSAEQGMQVSLIGFEADPTGVHPTSLHGALHCAVYPIILHQGTVQRNKLSRSKMTAKRTW